MANALHTRIGLLSAGLALTAIALLSAIAFEFQRTTSITWAQRLNHELAGYIADHLERPLIREDGSPDLALIKNLATDIMTVNPSVELYLLNAQGQVLAHALEKNAVTNTQIDLAPIKEFLQLKGIGRTSHTVLGDDPRLVGRKSGFSAAQIESSNRQHKGFLYIVLYGEQSRRAAEQLELDSRKMVWISFIALASVVGLLAACLAYHFLTRPLRKLITKVGENANLPLKELQNKGDEIAILSSEFERLNQRIAEQITQLKNNDLHRRELIANLSHDMRTPLAGIQGYIELASHDEKMTVHSSKSLGIALKQCASMNKRIDDLLTIARLETSSTELVAETFSLKELLHDVLQGFQVRAKKANIHLDIVERTFVVATDLMFTGDISLLERLFSNLIDNALCFTDSNGRVWIDIAGDHQHVAISVMDSGIGMTKKTITHAFERHWSSRSSTGLGLAIVRKICHLHQIELRIQSNTAGSERGTQFELIFPRDAVKFS